MLVGSPWVGGKALATASPAIPFAAVLGAGWLASRGRRLAAAGVAAVVAGGVLWSNALGYGGASLAPHDQLAELERIGERIAGQGPTLMTEYEPYGARHFLREADPRGSPSSAATTIPLRDGSQVAEGRLRRHRPDRPGARSATTGRWSCAARRRRAGRRRRTGSIWRGT